MRYSMNCQMYLLIILSMVVLGYSESAQEIYSRSRRNVINFSNMIKCETGRSGMDYVNYGCYCGLGGKGRILDAVDRCCHDHDDCYRQLRKKGVCSWLALYFVPYKHTCSKCSPKNKGCSRELCRCDRRAVRCFKRNKYNPSKRNVNKDKVC